MRQSPETWIVSRYSKSESTKDGSWVIEKIRQPGRQEHASTVSLGQEVPQTGSLEAKGDNTAHRAHVFSFEDRLRIYESNATSE